MRRAVVVWGRCRGDAGAETRSPHRGIQLRRVRQAGAGHQADHRPGDEGGRHGQPRRPAGDLQPRGPQRPGRGPGHPRRPRRDGHGGDDGPAGGLGGAARGAVPRGRPRRPHHRPPGRRLRHPGHQLHPVLRRPEAASPTSCSAAGRPSTATPPRSARSWPRSWACRRSPTSSSSWSWRTARSSARRNVGNGWEVVACRLPVLLTVMETANTPRPPAAKRMMKYKKARCPGRGRQGRRGHDAQRHRPGQGRRDAEALPGPRGSRAC